VFITFRTTTADKKHHKAAATLLRSSDGTAVLALRRGLLRKKYVKLIDELTQAACTSCPLNQPNDSFPRSAPPCAGNESRAIPAKTSAE
jgi:hypothetical protein